MYKCDKIYEKIERIHKLEDELLVVLGNDKKVKELIKHAKTTVKMIPEKYVDYISPVDQVPAIFDLIEIIVDKRADNIKTVADTKRARRVRSITPLPAIGINATKRLKSDISAETERTV